MTHVLPAQALLCQLCSHHLAQLPVLSAAGTPPLHTLWQEHLLPCAQGSGPVPSPETPHPSPFGHRYYFAVTDTVTSGTAGSEARALRACVYMCVSHRQRYYRHDCNRSFLAMLRMPTKHHTHAAA